MDKYIAMALPPPPVGSGLDKILAYVDSITRHSAQTLVSLSPFIIPLLIAAVLKITRLAGPIAALVVVLPVLGALLNAESVLTEMSLMPLPDDRLKAGKTGKPIYPVESYDEKAKLLMEFDKQKKSKGKAKNKPVKLKPMSDKQKDEARKKLEAARHLQSIVQGGTELSDGPIVQQTRHVLSTNGTGSSGIAGSLTSAPAGVAAPAPHVVVGQDGVHRAAVVTGNAPVLRGPPGFDRNAVETTLPPQFMVQFDSVHRTLYGQPADDGMTMGRAQREVDRMCSEIGVAPTRASSYEAISEALSRAAKAIGC